MEVFTIHKEDINGRLDCFYYRPEFADLEKKVVAKTDKILGDYIIEIAGGATPRIEESDKYYTDDPKIGIPFLRVQNVSPEGLKLDDIKYITPFTHKNLLKRSQVKENDLITKITGVGRMAVSSVAPQGFKGNINQHLVAIKTKGYQTSKLLATFLNTDIGEKLAKRRSTGGTRPALDYQALKTIPIIYKHEIMDIMETAFSKKKQTEREVEELLNSYAQLINELVKIDLSHTSERKIFSLQFSNLEGALNPERYSSRLSLDNKHSWIQIKDIGEIIRETFTPSHTNPEDEYGLIRIDDLDNNPQNAKIRDVQGKDVNGIILKVEANDILVARLAPTLGNKKTIITPDYRRKLIASNEFICLRCHRNINPVFVLVFLKTDFYKDLMIQRSRGAVPSRRRLSHEDFVVLPFPNIDKAFQDKIANKFIERIKRAEKAKKETNEMLEQAKKEAERILLG